MNQELKDKFQQIIESNFSKMESEVLTRLISEHEELKKKTATYEEVLEFLKKEVDQKNAECEKRRDENAVLRKDIADSNMREKAATEAHDKMKKEFVELELKCLRANKDDIFKLTEIAFRNPAKLRTFNASIPVDQFESYYDNQAGTNRHQRVGQYVEEREGREKTEEV